MLKSFIVTIYRESRLYPAAFTRTGHTSPYTAIAGTAFLIPARYERFILKAIT